MNFETRVALASREPKLSGLMRGAQFSAQIYVLDQSRKGNMAESYEDLVWRNFVKKAYQQGMKTELLTLYGPEALEGI